jgi:ABC-2 type transport system ATP-binding protein
MTQKTQTVATISNVGKSFGDKQVLSGINMQLHQSEILSVLGPNGAGKTTLINTMLGRLSLDAGEISLFGHSPGSMLVKRQTGAMLQVAGLPDMSTVKEHIELFQSYYAEPMSYQQVMDYSGLKDIENQFSKTLSGGQKQRLLFALAICGNPKLLFLDEPTVGMDITARKSLWKAIENLKANGTSILLTTHYLEEADRLSDRIVMLSRGKVVREGTPAQIKSQINTKKIRFQSKVNISELVAIKHVEKATQLHAENHYFELESTNAEEALKELFKHEIAISDLTIVGAALEDAFEIINNQDSTSSASE